MIVYGNPLSPFVRKVLVYGEERGIAMTMKPIVLGQPDAEFLEVSPFAKMPGLRDGEFKLSDSTAIIAYLEAKHPDGALMPKDPEAIGRTVWFEEFVDTVAFAAAAPIFFNRVVAKLMGREGDAAVADNAQANVLPPIYAYLESQLRAADMPLVGDSFGIADIAVGSVLMNMGHCAAGPEAELYPKLCAWRAATHARPSFAKWHMIESKILGR